jgi:hypothetical protein
MAALQAIPVKVMSFIQGYIINPLLRPFGVREVKVKPKRSPARKI